MILKLWLRMKHNLKMFLFSRGFIPAKAGIYFCLKIIFFVFFLFVTQAAVAKVPGNFTKAKKMAQRIYADHRVTFYCGCKFDKQGVVDLKSCGYTIQKDKRRARRLEWEHIVPVSHWGNQLPCWREALCCQKHQKCYKGRSCCRKMDKRFREMESDLHNLVPEIGELNAIRSNYRFGILGEVPKGQLGACEFKIDKASRRVEPCNDIKGTIARAYLYMQDQYSMALSKSQTQLFLAWNKQYPPLAWEIEWDKRISHIQGNHNRYISEFTGSHK